MPLALAAILLIVPNLPLRGQETAASERFRLDGNFSAASGQSASPTFQLSACMCEGIGGIAASESFTVIAGCAAFIPAKATPRPRPDPDPRLLSAAGPDALFPGPSPRGDACNPAVVIPAAAEGMMAGKK